MQEINTTIGITPRNEAPLKARAVKVKQIRNAFIVIDADGNETSYPTFQNIHPNMRDKPKPRNVVEHLETLFEEKDVGTNRAA